MKLQIIQLEPYDDVVSVRGRNPFIKALKDIGSISVLAAGTAAFLPVWLSLEGLSFLLHGEGLPDCCFAI